METTTDSGIDTRELTATEVKIAFAQIIDRMTRAVNARNEIGRWIDKVDWRAYPRDDDKFTIDLEDVSRKARKKFDIPEKLTLNGGGDDDGQINKGFISEYSPLIKRWVAGELHGEVVEQLMEQLGEFHHCPVGWAFLEKFEPASMWSLNTEIFTELVRIGSRSSRKYPNDIDGEPFKPSLSKSIWTGAGDYRRP